MRFLLNILFLVLVIATNSALASPLVVSPGGADDIVINEDDTINATSTAHLGHILTSSSSGKLQISLVNNLASKNVKAYVTGLDTSGALVMLQPDGSWYYPTATSSGIPQAITGNVAISLGAQGSTTTITLPGYLSSGRVYFADGSLQFFTVAGGNGASLVTPSAVNPSDPNAGVNWGFVELTNDPTYGLYANLSYVDFVGLPLGISLESTVSATQTAKGVSAGAVAAVCAALKKQASADGQPWDQLCMTDSSGKTIRVLSPTQYVSENSTAFTNYWTSYIDQVWNYYKTTPLQINTQAAAGVVNCTVTGSMLYCTGDNRGYAKPTASDIFGCASGTFAILGGDNAVHYAVVPRLCAAFHRTTFLLSGGNIQPNLGSSSFYTKSPTNYYSKLVHTYEVDGKGYAFAYDDVTPTDSVNESGLLADANPKILHVTIGGPLSATSVTSHTTTKTTTKSTTKSTTSSATTTSKTTTKSTTKATTTSSTIPSKTTTKSTSSSTKATSVGTTSPSIKITSLTVAKNFASTSPIVSKVTISTTTKTTTKSTTKSATQMSTKTSSVKTSSLSKTPSVPSTKTSTGTATSSRPKTSSTSTSIKPTTTLSTHTSSKSTTISSTHTSSKPATSNVASNTASAVVNKGGSTESQKPTTPSSTRSIVSTTSWHNTTSSTHTTSRITTVSVHTSSTSTKTGTTTATTHALHRRRAHHSV